MYRDKKLTNTALQLKDKVMPYVFGYVICVESKNKIKQYNNLSLTSGQ